MFIGVGMILGNEISQSLMVETDEDGKCIGKFLQVCVRVNILEPLRRGAHIIFRSKEEMTWVEF